MFNTISQSYMMIFSLVFLLSFLFFGPCFCVSVEEECSNQFTKVVPCLSYGTGKSEMPTNQCCSSVKDMRETNPVCLCFMIQQVHKGESSVKQMGLQEDKLLQLPSICKLDDTSIAKCPKLLNISPSSPDNAIFTNSSSTESSTLTASVPASPKMDDVSASVMLGANLAMEIGLVAAFLFLKA